MTQSIFILMNGITMAALLFIMAIGLNLSFGLLKVINMAHGVFYLLGGYIGLSVLTLTNSWVLGLLAGATAAALLALVAEVFLLRKARGNAIFEALITISIAIIFSDLIIALWGGRPKAIAMPEVFRGFINLFGINFPIYNLFVIALACLIGVFLWIFLQKTKVGMIVRAGVDNFEMVAAIGINIKALFTMIFVLAGFLAGLAGVIGGTHLMLAPGEDWRILTFTLLVVIIGGMGSFGGTIVGALIIGLIASWGGVHVPQFALFLMFAPVALILILRPSGLFGRQT